MSEQVLVRCLRCGLEVQGTEDAEGVVRAARQPSPTPRQVEGICVPCLDQMAEIRAGRATLDGTLGLDGGTNSNGGP